MKLKSNKLALIFLGVILILLLAVAYSSKSKIVPNDCPIVYIYADSLAGPVSNSEEATSSLKNYLNGANVNEEVSRLASYQPIESLSFTEVSVRMEGYDTQANLYLSESRLIGVSEQGSIYTKLVCI